MDTFSDLQIDDLLIVTTSHSSNHIIKVEAVTLDGESFTYTFGGEEMMSEKSDIVSNLSAENRQAKMECHITKLTCI